MTENQERPTPPSPANDNGGARARIEGVVVTLARLVGRQLARDHFGRRDGVNDNRPPPDGGDRRHGNEP